MSGKSKLDLLKRYGSASASKEKIKKKRKKINDVKSVSAFRDTSEDDFIPSAKRVNNAWEDAEGEDELPVVVDEVTGVTIPTKKLGSWEEVRNDSPSPPRRPTRNDSPSPPRRTTRNDSPSPPSKSSRNDSPSPPRRTTRNDSPSPPRRSSRNDSPSPPRKSSRNDSPSPPRRTTRNDSPSPPRRSSRNDSPSPPRRSTRKDTPSPPRRSSRNDSPSPPRRSTRKDSPSPPRRSSRNDSPSPPRRTTRKDNSPSPRPVVSIPSPAASSSSSSDDEGKGPRRATKTATGHSAGLLSAKDFIAEDRKLKAKQLEAAKAAGASAGEAQETVYRDKRGRKLDMLNQMMRQQAIAEGKAVAEEKEAYEWGKGTAQKNLEAAHAQELANIKLEPFARMKDDAKMDQMFRERIHADDPMAQYMLKKKDKQEEEHAKAVVAAGGPPPKPKYKGPTPRPNRFGIMPGYRWDGRDRGTGWEEKVLGQAAAKQRSKDASYQWSVSDM